MIYKLAAEKKKREVNVRKIKQDARKRADLAVTSYALDETIGNGGRAAESMSGHMEGRKIGHPMVGAFWGPVGVNGAVAKNTGVSTLHESTQPMANMLGTVGALGGAVIGGTVGAQTGGLKGLLVGVPAGALGMGGAGYLSGHIVNGARYAGGYVFGERKPKGYKRYNKNSKN